MAKIYGCAESEKKTLDICPSSVKRYEDIDRIHRELNNRLKKESQDFFDKLPQKIKEEETILEMIRRDEKDTIQILDKKIKDIKDSIKIDKHNKKWFPVVFGFFQLLIQKHISKPLKIRKIKISEVKQKLFLVQWKENPEYFFNRQQSELINEIADFTKIKEDPQYSGAYGELKVLNELSKLNEEYTILCGLNIKLDKWHSYGSKVNLKSAQMDFVVVSFKGVFLIEVKNWGSDYYNQNKNFSPHEQLDRAGRVLYIFLKSELHYDVAIQRRINKILVPLKNNIPYNPNYESVLVSSLDKINDFISNRRDVLSDYEVKQIIDTIKQFVTEKTRS